MEGLDREVGKVHPFRLVKVGEVSLAAINDGTQVELRTKSIELSLDVHVDIHDGSLIDVKGMGAFPNRHIHVDTRIEVGWDAADIDNDGVLGGKSDSCNAGKGVGV